MLKKQIRGNKKVKDEFIKLGINIPDLESNEKFSEKYSNFNWYLLPHHRVEYVLYSVPPKKDLEILPWESWYIDEGKETHHVHFGTKKNEDDFDWIQKEWTPERPDEVIGKTWYWYADSDITPVLIKGDNFKIKR